MEVACVVGVEVARRIVGRKIKPKAAVALEKELATLQHDLAMIDFWLGGEPGVQRFLVLMLEDIGIRMDGNKNHKRPHVHIEYGTDHHAASYAIDTGERLVGKLKSEHDRAVREWIKAHKSKLMEVWQATQAGKNPHPIICELRGGLAQN